MLDNIASSEKTACNELVIDNLNNSSKLLSNGPN